MARYLLFFSFRCRQGVDTVARYLLMVTTVDRHLLWKLEHLLSGDTVTMVDNTADRGTRRCAELLITTRKDRISPSRL